MKTIIRNSFLLAILSVFFIACQKEVSFEKGNITVSVGSLLVDGLGNCTAVVSGIYYKDTTLKASNYVDVQVQVDTVGTYTISSDLVNGYSFTATGTFTATGVQTVRLVGTGKPLAAGTNIFTVTYNGTVCDFSVTVTAAAGGSAAFTVNCAGAVPAGTYIAGTPLTAANTITLNVNVTVIGTWSVTTAPAVNGMVFSGTGTFAAIGAQTIVLSANGSTPTGAGTFPFTVTGATATCTFQCTVTTVPDYFPRTTNSNWSYQYDDVFNDSILMKVTPQTLTVNGNAFNIFISTFGLSPGFDSSANGQYASYYRRSGSSYFEWVDMGSYVGLDDPYWMEYTFLKDDQIVGGNWMSNQFSGQVTPAMGAPFTVTLRWEFTIVQQNATVNVNGTNYANTIEVKQELKQFAGGNWLPQAIATFRYFYARDKGMIKQDLYDNANALVYELDVRRLAIY